MPRAGSFVTQRELLRLFHRQRTEQQAVDDARRWRCWRRCRARARGSRRFETIGVARSARIATSRRACRLRGRQYRQKVVRSVNGCPMRRDEVAVCRRPLGVTMMFDMLVALTRQISSADGVLRADAIWRACRSTLSAPVRSTANARQALPPAGCRVERLPAGPDMPDAVFVEDIAIVFRRAWRSSLSPGAESRRVRGAGDEGRARCPSAAPRHRAARHDGRRRRARWWSPSSIVGLVDADQRGRRRALRRRLAPHGMRSAITAARGCLPPAGRPSPPSVMSCCWSESGMDPTQNTLEGFPLRRRDRSIGADGSQARCASRGGCDSSVAARLPRTADSGWSVMDCRCAAQRRVKWPRQDRRLPAAA